jgi:predicted ester cyclase
MTTKPEPQADGEIGARAVDERAVRDLFGRFNDRRAFFADPEGTWVDRPHYRVYPQNLEMHTRDEVVSWFHGLFDSLPGLHMEVEDVVVAGRPGRERVTVRWHLTGMFTGEPYMGIAATGRRVELHGMDLVDFKDGRVAANCIYFDQLSFARQVGMLPPEGSRRDRLMTWAFNLTVGARTLLRGRR